MSHRPGRVIRGLAVAVAVVAGCGGGPSPSASAGPSARAAPSSDPGSPTASPADASPDRARLVADGGAIVVELPDGWRASTSPEEIADALDLLGLIALGVEGIDAIAIHPAEPLAAVLLITTDAGSGITSDGLAAAAITARTDVEQGIHPDVEPIDTASGPATWIAGWRSYRNDTGSGPAIVETEEVSVVLESGGRGLELRVIVARGDLAATRPDLETMAASLTAAGDAPPLEVTWTCDAQIAPAADVDPAQGQTVVDGGASHVDPSEAIAYPACPPVSGSHLGAPAAPIRTRFYEPDEPLAPQYWLHNLEHGDLAILYDCAQAGGACEPLVDELQAVLADLAPSALCERPRSALAMPYDGLPTLIAVAAWGRILFLDSVEGAAIATFHAARSDRGPERSCAAAAAEAP